MRQMILCSAAVCLGLATPALAEFELGGYVGFQTSPHSRIKGDYPGGGDIDALIGWEGRSFEMPPYYGVRGTWWRSERFGLALEFTHAKAYAPDDEREENGFDRLEFTDGHNIITLNGMYRWPGHWPRTTPYVGAGLGIALPHVDIEPTGGEHTFGYQLTGPAAKLIAGVSYELSDRYSVFGEYQFSWSENQIDLEGGGDMQTRIITNALNVGISLNF